MDEEEEAFCRAAGALGLDPFALDPEVADAIISSADLLPPALANDFFASVDVSEIQEKAELVAESLRMVSESEIDVEALRELKGQYARGFDFRRRPWKEGYRVARDLRERLGMDSEPVPSLEALGAAFGVGGQDLSETIVSPPGMLGNVDALLSYNRRESPGFVIDRKNDVALRFAYCRGLFEHVVSPMRDPALITKARTEAQKRNRAFAAEFLLPADALRDRIDSELVTEDDVDTLASEFSVSWAVVRHQLENHRVARIQTE